MTTAESFQPATGRWDAFALASAAPLGSFTHAHLAPKFPPPVLNNALATYLQLREDELLLAIIDSGGRKPTERCALTTRHVYWIEPANQGEQPRDPRVAPPARSHTHQLVVRIANYADLPDRARVVTAADGSCGIDLGHGANIALGRDDGALAAAVARYLETMGRAARAGDVPEGVIDADLASRAARVLPDVARVTAQGRKFGQDITQFRAAMDAATPRAMMSPILIGTCVLVYAAMVATGVPWLWPSAEHLSPWGANQGTRVVLNHEYWRLVTNVFLHFGLIHLGMNMWSLHAIGPLIERLFGSLAFAVIYLASGVGGAVASLATDPRRVGAGASGAICGVLGALAAFMVIHRRAIPKSILKSFRGSLVSVVVFMAILGYFVPNIDQQAHVGGAVTGFLCGLLLSRPWPVIASRWVTLRRACATFLIAGALAAGAVGVVRRAAAPPEVRLKLLDDEIGPALNEYNLITAGGPSTLILSRDLDDPDARKDHLKSIRALEGRALANLAAFRRATTIDPRLQSMLNALVAAQSSQLEWLRAGERFLETGDRAFLDGPGGVLEARIATGKASRSYGEQRIRLEQGKNSTRAGAGP